MFDGILGASLLAIATGSQAQTTDVAGQTAGPASAQRLPTNEATPEAEAARGGIADIIVTANRREERLQDVPVTVTLVDGGQLTRQNVNAVEDLARTAPALNSGGPPGTGALSIRGIGGLSFSRSSEGSVGVVVDGVSLANTSTNPPLLFDVARVEVLEGPQGTLFGRNSSAGVVNIVTNAPDPSRVDVIAHTDVGTRNNYIVRGALNLPLSANAALRVAGSFAQSPQNQRNLFDGTYARPQAKAGRARLLWKPSAAVTVNLAADYTDTDIDGGTPWAVFASTPTSALSSRLRACGIVVGPDNQDGCVDTGYVASNKTYGVSGQIDVDLGGPMLTSITALRRARALEARDVDSSSANRTFQNVRDRTNNFSQELRLSSSNKGTIEYVAGLFYFKSTRSSVLTQSGRVLADLPLIGACPLPAAALCSLPFGQSRPGDTSVESYAAFGQATVNATDRLRFILGGRIGNEAVRAASSAATTLPGALAPITAAGAVSGDVEDTYLSYRVGAQYDVTNDVMAFATYTRGYKGPAVNDQATASTDPLIVRPEIPTSGEIGFKATVASGRAAINATAFYTAVDNFQAQFFDPALTAFIFGNAPKFTSKGISAQLFGRPIKGLTANLGVIYNETRFGAGYSVPDFRNVVRSAEGRQRPGAPKWKATFSTEYATPLSGTIEGFVQADVVYRSKVFFNAINDDVLSSGSGAIFGGRVGLRTSDQRFGASVFARNIFDTFRTTFRFPTPIAAQQLDPFSFSQFAGPESNRVIGLSLDARF